MYSKILVKFGQGVNILPKNSEWRRNAGNGFPSIEKFDACRHSGGVPADLGDLPCIHSLPVLRILALCDNLT